MAALEVLPIRSSIYIPENKRSVFVYKKGTDIVKKRDQEYQGLWVVDGYTIDKKKASDEIWFFLDADGEIDRRVLENEPLQGRWGYAPHVGAKKAKLGKGIDPKDVWFFPPKSAKCKIPSAMEEYIHMGTWVKPAFKRDFSQLGSNKSGFLTVSGDMRIAKGEKHSVTGKWNMMGFNDDVVRGKSKKNEDKDGGKGSYQIYVRKVNGVRFPISALPGHKISMCKKKIHQKKGIPIEDQRLSFNDVPLKDDKTVSGSGIKNGDTIDLNPMIIYVRNLKGKKFTFEVDPDELVDDVKKMVENREGTPAEKQRLYFKNWKLVDGKPISHFKVRHKSTLDMGGMIIFVQPVGDVPKIELEVEPTDTLKSIKLKVKKRINVPVAEQRMFFQEKEMLKDADTLESYSVQHMDTLFLRHDDDDDNKVNVGGSPPGIVVKTPNGDLPIPIDPDDTIKDVKKKVAKDLGVPPKNIRLQPEGADKPLKNVDKPTPGDILNVVPAKGETLPPPKKQETPSKGETLPPPKKPELFEVKDNKPIPQITVNVPGKNGPRIFHLDLEPDDTIDDVKKKIAELADLPVKDVHLLIGDEELDDTADPSKCQVMDVAPRIEVTLPDKKKVDLTILPKMTVDDLKDLIEEKTGMPKDQQRVFFLDNDGDEFNNNTPLSQLNIKPDTPLEIQPPRDEKVTIRQSPDGRSFYLTIDPDDGKKLNLMARLLHR